MSRTRRISGGAAVRCIRWFYCEPYGRNEMPYIPPIKPLPPNADAETRRRMYWEYVDLCVATNPSWFLPVGVRKQWWHFFKIEHPETSRDRAAVGCG